MINNHYQKYYEQDEIWNRGLDDLGEYEKKRVFSIISLIPKDVHTILDVGCGNGIITNKLYDKGYDVTGVDISKAALKKVRSKKKLSSCDNLDFPDKSFDLVLTSDLLEHLPEPIFLKTIKEMVRVSKKYIIVNTPNNEQLFSRFTKCNFCGTCFHIYRHLRSLSIKNLSKYFGDYGYSIKRVVYAGANKFYYIKPLQLLSQFLANNYIWNSIAICPACGENTKRIKKNYLRLLFTIPQYIFNLFIFKKQKSELIILFKRKCAE